MRIDKKIMVDKFKNHFEDFGKYINYINTWLEKEY